MAIFTERLFEKWSPNRTCVTPKKGMLVTSRHGEWDDTTNRHVERWYLIVATVVDEYGNCKFEMLSDNKTKWSDWITVKDFNYDYRIKNPWI